MDSSADEHFIRLMQGCYVEANRTAASEAAGGEGEAVRSRAREVARETEAAMEEGEEGSTRLLEEWRKIRYYHKTMKQEIRMLILNNMHFPEQGNHRPRTGAHLRPAGGAIRRLPRRGAGIQSCFENSPQLLFLI